MFLCFIVKLLVRELPKTQTCNLVMMGWQEPIITTKIGIFVLGLFK